MEQIVKTYKDQKAFSRDVSKMLQAGWIIASQTTYQPRSGIGRFLALGGIGALVFRPKQQVMVTYQRQPSAQAQQHYGQSPQQRQTFAEQIIQAKAAQKPGMSFMEQVRAARDQARQR